MERLSAKVATAQTFEDVCRIVVLTPRPDAPGRKYFVNLDYFQRFNLSVPGGASDAECLMYLELLRRPFADGYNADDKRNATEKLERTLQLG